MSVDINWGLATAQPNMLALAQQGFEQGRAQKMQGIQDQALAKISANPNDTSAINALLPVNPGLYGQLAGAQQQRQQAEQQATRQQAIGGALSQLDGLPEPVRMLAQSDPEGAMQLWEMTGKMDAQQQAAATANAEKLAAVVTGLAELPPEQRFAQAVQLAPQFGLDPAKITPEALSDQGIQVILAQAMGVKGVLDYRMKEREFDATQGYRQQTLGVQMRGQDMTDARARATAAASAARSGTLGAAGKPAKVLPPGEVTKLATEGETVQAIADLRSSYNPKFSGFGTGVENFAARLGVNVYDSSGQSADWWQRMDQFDNVVRNELFGASLTAGEQAAWERTTVTPGMAPARVKANLAKREELLARSLKRKTDALSAAGYAAEGVAGAVAPTRAAAPAAAAPTGGNDVDSLLQKYGGAQ